MYRKALRTKSTAALWKVWASPAAATSRNAPGPQNPAWISRQIRWKYRLTNRRLSLMPSSARPNRVELPRSGARWPSAESERHGAIRRSNPAACGLLVEQPPGPGDDEIHPDHKAAPPHVRHDRQLGFPALHLRQHLVAEPAGMLHQPVLDDRLDRNARRRRRERIAAVGRRAPAGVGPRLRKRDFLAGDHAAHGEAAAEPLPDREHVGKHALMLDREHLPGAPAPGDHLVADPQPAQLVRELAQQLQVTRRRHYVPRRALDRLADDRRDVQRRLVQDFVPQ